MGKHLYRTQKSARSSRVVSICAMIALALSIVACSSPARTINPDKPGVWRNPIFGIDPRENGVYILWATDDDTAGYCIVSEEHARIAIWATDPPDQKGEGLVIVHYVSLKDSVGNFRTLGAAACSGTEQQYSKGSNTYDILLVTSIREITSGGRTVVRDSSGFQIER